MSWGIDCNGPSTWAGEAVLPIPGDETDLRLEWRYWLLSIPSGRVR